MTVNRTQDRYLVGAWSEAHDRSPQEYPDGLIERHAELPSLRALFFGDMTSEECEISWIESASLQRRLQPLRPAIPRHAIAPLWRGAASLATAT